MWRVCMVAFSLVLFHTVTAQRAICSTIRTSQENAQIHVPQPYLSTRNWLSRRREEEGAWRGQSSSQGPGMPCLAKPLSLLGS